MRYTELIEDLLENKLQDDEIATIYSHYSSAHNSPPVYRLEEFDAMFSVSDLPELINKIRDDFNIYTAKYYAFDNQGMMFSSPDIRSMIKDFGIYQEMGEWLLEEKESYGIPVLEDLQQELQEYRNSEMLC